MKSILSIESIILIVICLADMISTLIMTAHGIAVEQNPIMAVCLKHSAGAFIAVKLISFVPFVVVTEWYRRKNPVFARQASWAAILIYVAAYVFVTAGVNLV